MKLKIKKIKIKIKNPIKAVAKVLTAPVVIPTKMAVSQISEKAAAGIGGSLGYTKKENNMLKMAGKIGTIVAGGAALKAITSAPAVSAGLAKAESVKSAFSAKTAVAGGIIGKAKSFGGLFKSAGENSGSQAHAEPANVSPEQKPADAVVPQKFFLALWLDKIFGIGG